MNVKPRCSILVVEDENVVAMDLASSLERLHYHVAGVASTGEDAISMAERTAPSLVLMDIHLRGQIDGIEAAQKIQEKLFIPVVYLTAYSDESTLHRAQVTHPFGYVLKPFDDRELEVAIEVARFRHEMERALRDSERRLDAILASIADAVIATDSDRRITFLNRAAEALFGWKTGRAQGRLLSDVVKLTAESGGPPRLRRNGGELISIELVESTVYDAAGSAAGYVTIARDISERLRAQEAHDRELIERAARSAAENEHERARLKSEISLALADITQMEVEVVLRHVADLIVQSLATLCVLHVEEPRGAIRITSHADHDKIGWANEVLRRWPLDPNATRGISVVMRNGRPELLSHSSDDALAEIAQDPEHLEVLRKIGMTSYVRVPLRARHRVIGALVLISCDEERRYGSGDVTLAQQIADRIALAVDNRRLFRDAQEAKASAERLYEAEQRARSEAQSLFRIADALSETQLNLEALVQRVTDEATALVDAQFGAFFYNTTNETGDAYVLYSLSGASKDSFEKFGLPRNTPLFATTFAGQGVVRLEDVRADPRYGKLPPHYGMPPGHLPVTSYLAVPVISRSGLVIGGLFFGHSEPARFTERHEHMVKAVAAHAAVAIDNARLFQAAREGEEHQKRLVAELERTVRFSEMFIGILGHDLRNPLSGITAGAGLILNRSDSERVSSPAKRILTSAARMSRMIDQILDFTHVRIGRGIPLMRRRVDLGEVCRAVLEELGAAAIRLDVRGNLAGVWDPDRLAQLVSNLIGNAVQHRVDDTAVSVFADGERSETATLVIENEGVIAPDLLPVIFEPFRGQDTKKKEGSSGLGLGLYICQQIAAAHGGSIAAESREGRTRFVVVLPRATAMPDAQVFGTSSAEEGSR